MQIAGFEKNSFIDFPGKIAAVIFSPGCNFDCWYCHNKGIKDEGIKFDEVVAFLLERKGFIDGVVFSGGEPTLQKDLADRIKEVKALGFLIKLDTNGSTPQVLQALLDLELLDYVAMDFHAPLSKFKKMKAEGFEQKVQESLEILKKSGINYEIRTTFSPDLLHEDIREIAKSVKGARLFVVQQYRQQTRNGLLEPRPHSPEYVRQAVEIANAYVKTIPRGI